jgi:hypothetical protein
MFKKIFIALISVFVLTNFCYAQDSTQLKTFGFLGSFELSNIFASKQITNVTKSMSYRGGMYYKITEKVNIGVVGAYGTNDGTSKETGESTTAETINASVYGTYDLFTWGRTIFFCGGQLGAAREDFKADSDEAFTVFTSGELLGVKTRFERGSIGAYIRATQATLDGSNQVHLGAFASYPFGS